MLPCQNECSGFREGCHKSCVRWKERLRIQQEENLRRKNYLRIHNELSAEQLRQLRQLAQLRIR